MEIVILVLIVCAIVAALIYSSKGQSAFWGCVIGFLLGPIGVLIAALASRVDQEQEELKAGQLRRCPWCKETIRPDANVCKHCGRDVKPAFEKTA